MMSDNNEHGSLIWVFVMGALVGSMILHTIHKKEEREHIMRYHPQMLQEYDDQEYEARVSSHDKRG